MEGVITKLEYTDDEGYTATVATIEFRLEPLETAKLLRVNQEVTISVKKE